MKKVIVLLCFFYFSFSYGQLYISEVSDANSYNNEFLEIYNNSDSPIDLTGYKLIRVDTDGLYVFDFGEDESNGGDLIIQAKNFLIVARGNTKSDFESEWGSLPTGVAYNSGNTSLYFGTSVQRRWKLRSNDGTSNKDDGTLLDDTYQVVGGSGKRHYKENIGGAWIEESSSTATPGSFDSDQSLPISLVSFRADLINNAIRITWTTQSEMDNAGFEILRSTSREGEYRIITSYLNNPALLGQGNSNYEHRYSFVDRNVIPGQTYWYKLVDVDFNGDKMYHGPISATVHMNGQIVHVSSKLPNNFRLYPNYPNPFNPTTTLKFDIPDLDHGAPVKVSLVIYNSLGEVVKEFYNGPLSAGTFQVIWDGRNQQGVSQPSGIYYAVLHADYFTSTMKMILLK